MEDNMSWNYLLPTRSDIPARLQSKISLYRDEYPEFRLGIYCAQQAHQNAPWLIGSFEPAWTTFRETGELHWSIRDKYSTGDGILFDVAGTQTPIIANGKRVPTNDHGQAIQQTADHHSGYQRPRLECKECGFKVDYRLETVQGVIQNLLKVEWLEIDLQDFKKAVELAKANE